MSDVMKARPKYNRTSKKYNIVINYNGKEIFLGTGMGLFVVYNEFATKQEAVDYIKSKNKLVLAKNVEDMMQGVI